MRKLMFILIAACLAQSVSAQPEARRREQRQAAAASANALSTRAQISFPTQAPMNEDVVWRRDIYREIDLNDEANAALYYPVEPLGSQMNLFTYIFKLVMRRSVTPYEYRLDGNEVFDESAKVNLMSILDNYHIFYERTDRGHTNRRQRHPVARGDGILCQGKRILRPGDGYVPHKGDGSLSDTTP